MAAKRSKWFAAIVGGLATVGIAWAGLSIAQQLKPRRAPDDAPPALPGVTLEERQQRDRRLLAAIPGPVERVDGPAAKIVPAHLAWEGAAGRGGLLDDFDGCLPAGEGIDVVWNRGQLYSMRKKGRLKLVFAADDVNDHFSNFEGGGTSVCFDGRYVWAALTRHRKTALLIVLDPQSDQTWTLGAEEGLPCEPASPDPQQQGQRFAIGSVAPGKACIATSSGPAQLALVEFAPQTGAKFEVLSLDKLASAPQTDLTRRHLPAGQGFRPAAIFNLAQPGEPASQRIAVSCGANLTQFSGPLLIDPATRSIEVATSIASGSAVNNSRLANVGGAMYWIERVPTEPPRFVLARAGSPKFEEEFLFDEAPQGAPVPYNDRIAFLGEHCWLWKPGERRIEELAVEVPWLYHSHVDPQAPLPPRKVDGEEWQLDVAFASQHYGVLVKAKKFVRPNSHFSDYLFYQFALADDPRIESISPAPAVRRELAVELPPGTAASELRVFAAQGDRSPLARLDKSVEADSDDQRRFPILAREVVRQALLVAARDQLQWATRDETLSESGPSADETPAAKWVLSTRFPYAGPAEFVLQKIDADGSASEVWSERLALNEDEEHPLDYAALVAAAERWSRETFPALLKQGDLGGEPRPVSTDAAISPEAAEWLKQMTFTAQFAALRDLHQAIGRQGESADRLGALSQAYANLGVLSEFPLELDAQGVQGPCVALCRAAGRARAAIGPGVVASGVRQGACRPARRGGRRPRRRGQTSAGRRRRQTAPAVARSRRGL